MFPPLSLTLTALLTAAAANAQKPDLVIANVTIVDVEQGLLLADRTVSIADGKIARIDTGEAAPTDTGERIDGTDKFLIPGLIDIHVHTAREGLPIPLEYGVTTVRDMGIHFAPLEPDSRGQLAMRAEIEAVIVNGKRYRPDSNDAQTE